MTPLGIRIALHYYVSPQDYEALHPGCDAARQVLMELVGAGLLIDTWAGAETADASAPRFTASDGLRVYVEALQAVPLPTRQWVMP